MTHGSHLHHRTLRRSHTFSKWGRLISLSALLLLFITLSTPPASAQEPTTEPPVLLPDDIPAEAPPFLEAEDHLSPIVSPVETAPALADIPIESLGPLSSIQDIQIGGNHACTLMTNGTIKCWGSNVMVS